MIKVGQCNVTDIVRIFFENYPISKVIKVQRQSENLHYIFILLQLIEGEKFTDNVIHIML